MRKRLLSWLPAFAVFVLPLAGQDFRLNQELAHAGVRLGIHQSTDGAIIEFRVRNADTRTYAITIAMQLDNMRSTVSLPFRGTVRASSGDTPLFRIMRVDPGRPFYYRNFTWNLQVGSAPPARPVTHNGVYQYPWARGKAFTVDNGFNGFGAHRGAWAYAVDFKMPQGTPVHAAREGIVTATEARFSRGGNDPSLGDKANYVFIEHPDGSTGRYLHLKQNGVAVRVNGRVRTGDLIGYSGNTGWSTDPHLHFDVTVPDPQHGMKTVPFKFRDASGRLFEPRRGMRLVHGTGEPPAEVSRPSQTVQLRFECFGSGPLDDMVGCHRDQLVARLKTVGCNVPKVEGSSGRNTAHVRASDGKVWPYHAGLVAFSTNCYFAPGSGDACRERNAPSTTVQMRRGTLGENRMVCVCNVKSHPLAACDPSAR